MSVNNSKEIEMILKTVFLNVDDVMTLLNSSKSKSYQIINDLNKELKKDKKITFLGRVSSSYFRERTSI